MFNCSYIYVYNQYYIEDEKYCICNKEVLVENIVKTAVITL